MMVALALPILIGLGLWQVSRLHWKQQVIAEMQAAATLPTLHVTGPIPPGSAFRTADMLLDCPAQVPLSEAARNLKGESGWSHILACTAPGGESAQLMLGWSGAGEPPASETVPAGQRQVQGVLVPGAHVQWRLYPPTAPAPLLPVQPPTPETMPNNHRLYAIQWFAFAGILLVIYGLWVRRWVAQRPPAA